MNCPFISHEWVSGMRLPICGLVPRKTCKHSEDTKDNYSFALCFKNTLEEVPDKV